MVFALRVDDKDFDDTDRSDDFIAGMFGGLVKRAEKKNDASKKTGELRQQLKSVQKTDDSEPKEDARDRFHKRSRDGYKTPLRMSRDKVASS